MGVCDSLAVLYGARWITGPAGLLLNISAILTVLLMPIRMLLTGRTAQCGELKPADRPPIVPEWAYSTSIPATWLCS